MLKPYEGRKLDVTKPVKVYRNITDQMLSVVQGKLVVAHATEIQLEGAVFRVQPAGLEKCRQTKTKNVHAYVQGFVTNSDINYDESNRIRYNPYKYDTFVNEYGDEVTAVNHIKITNDGKMVYA